MFTYSIRPDVLCNIVRPDAFREITLSIDNPRRAAYCRLPWIKTACSALTNVTVERFLAKYPPIAATIAYHFGPMLLIALISAVCLMTRGTAETAVNGS